MYTHIYIIHTSYIFIYIIHTLCIFIYILYILNVYSYIYYTYFMHDCGPGSSVGIVTAYGLDGPEIESRRGEIFRTSLDRP